MQRKRNEGGGWQAAGWRFCSETAPSIAKTVSPAAKSNLPETKTIPPTAKTITTFDTFRQNRDFHRML
jgi:hypothetical protein